MEIFVRSTDQISGSASLPCQATNRALSDLKHRNVGGDNLNLFLILTYDPKTESLKTWLFLLRMMTRFELLVDLKLYVDTNGVLNK